MLNGEAQTCLLACPNSRAALWPASGNIRPGHSRVSRKPARSESSSYTLDFGSGNAHSQGRSVYKRVLGDKRMQVATSNKQRSVSQSASGSTRKKAFYNLLVLLSFAAGCFLAFHCFASDLHFNQRDAPLRLGAQHGHSSIAEQRSQGSRLKLTLNNVAALPPPGLKDAPQHPGSGRETDAATVGQKGFGLEEGDGQKTPLSTGRSASRIVDIVGDAKDMDVNPQGVAQLVDKQVNSSDVHSNAALLRQRSAALDLLYSSGLLRNRTRQKTLPQFQHLETDRSKCPLRYDRMDYEDIRRGRYQPYLLGERAKPECNNCDVDNLWSHFCQFQTHGPVCPGWLKWQLASDWVKRAEAGSPGVRELLRLTPCDLFKYLKDKTLWLVGDSLTLEWDKAVRCFLYEFWDLEDESLQEILPSVPRAIQGWCSNMAQGAKICFVRANTGFELAEGILPLLPALGARTTDVMVVNFAIWSNREGEYRRNMTRFSDYYRAHKQELPITVWRDAPVQHFDTTSGDYVWPVTSANCKALPDVELLQDNTLRALHPSAQIIAEGGWRNKLALPMMQTLGIPIMHTWNQTLPMWQYHTNFSEKDGDCTHMCHPSEYQYWVFELYKMLQTLFPSIQ